MATTPDYYLGTRITLKGYFMKNFAYITLSLLFCACETVIEVDVPRNPSQLTVNALFNPDSVWQVELTQNRYILDNEPFASVPDAEVRILQEGQTVASLDYVGNTPFTRNSIYRSESSYPQPEESYTLEVTHPTFVSLSASSQVPVNESEIFRAVLDTLDERPESLSSFADQVAYGLTIQLQDPPEKNFYSVSAEIRWEQIGNAIVDDSIIGAALSIEHYLTRVRSDDPVVDDSFDNYREELLFKDISFNGETYELKLYMTFDKDNGIYTDLFAEPLVLQDENIYDFQGNVFLVPGDTFGINTLHILLRTVTEEYYEYNYTRDLQASVENNPFAQPVQVLDNVEGGLGIFAGYSQVEKQVTFQ